jgi:hypothetical protein
VYYGIGGSGVPTLGNLTGDVQSVVNVNIVAIYNREVQLIYSEFGTIISVQPAMQKNKNPNKVSLPQFDPPFRCTHTLLLDISGTKLTWKLQYSN